jgi:hypothetical protein
MRSFFSVEKVPPKMWASSGGGVDDCVLLAKPTQSKQSTKGRIFGQSGHPGCQTVLVWGESARLVKTCEFISPVAYQNCFSPSLLGTLSSCFFLISLEIPKKYSAEFDFPRKR